LHWDHRGEAHNVIGSIDPMSMRETSEGLRVEGKLDLEDSEVAREAWRSMKANRVSLSFGYLATRACKRSDGVRELAEIDLFEISVIPHPANADTRFLSLKSADSDLERVRTEARDSMLAVLTAADKKALELERKRTAPIKVATSVV
jgi:HK97 family phage prohead protease